MSWTDSESNQDDKVAQLSEENFRIYALSNLSKSLSVPDWQAGLRLFTRKCVGRGDISEKIIDIDAELCKPRNKIACFEKETRLETWQYFMTRHFEICFQKEAGGQHCQIWDSVSHWKWAQNKVWVGSSIPNGNHCFLIWDSFSQGSRTIETNAFKGQGHRQCWESQRTQWLALCASAPCRERSDSS